MEEAVSEVINKFKSEGKDSEGKVGPGWDTIAYNGEYVYGCMEKDIPKGAVDSYAPINSNEAREWVKESLENGYSY